MEKPDVPFRIASLTVLYSDIKSKIEEIERSNGYAECQLQGPRRGCGEPHLVTAYLSRELEEVRVRLADMVDAAPRRGALVFIGDQMSEVCCDRLSEDNKKGIIELDPENVTFTIGNGEPNENCPYCGADFCILSTDVD